MRTVLCMAILAGFALLTTPNESDAFHPFQRNVTQINVGAGGAPLALTQVHGPGLFPGHRNVTQINVGVPPTAIVNSQALIDPRFHGQLNQLNSYTFTNNSPANIVFSQRQAVLLNHPVITQAPIVEQLTYQTPATIIQRVVAPQSAVTYSSTDPSVQYIQQPQQQSVQYVQTCPQQTQALTQPNVQYQTAPQQSVQYIQQTVAPSQVLSQAVYDPGTTVVQQTRTLVNQPLAVVNQNVIVRQHAIVSQRHFIQHFRSLPAVHHHGWHRV